MKSIKINHKVVPLNTSLLTIDGNGNGGTVISTLHPYTTMHTSIYNSVVDAFVKEIGYKVPRVAAVKPFGTCFNWTYIRKTQVVPAVPATDFVLQSDRSVYWNWRMFGANTMVKIGNEV